MTRSILPAVCHANATLEKSDIKHVFPYLLKYDQKFISKEISGKKFHVCPAIFCISLPKVIHYYH